MDDILADLNGRLAARRPGWSLERAFYTDPAVFAHDLDAVHRRHWLLAGHVSEAPEPGTWFTVELAGESLIIARDASGAFHALFNVCRHRGSRICLEPSGRAKKLVCPYHQWVFAADGALLAARGMPEGFDKAAFGLHRARLALCEGLIFVCLADEAPDFAPIAADFARFLGPHRLAEARIGHREVHVVEANWKLLLENFRECYHCAATHPEYCATVFGGARKPPEAVQRRLAFLDESMARWKAQGLPAGSVPFTPTTWHHVGRGILAEGWKSWSLDGRPIAPLMGDVDRDSGLVGAVMYPSFWLEGGCDYLTTSRVLPLGPTTSQVQITWYVAAGAEAGRDFEVERLTAVWGATARQDMTLAQNNQAGVNSLRYQPGPYSDEEADLEHILAWYQRQWSEAAKRPAASACRAAAPVR